MQLMNLCCDYLMAVAFYRHQMPKSKNHGNKKDRKG
jgi:hypothetical protein